MTEQRILIVIDKDGTLTEAKSGATFPQSPTDQELMQGVPKALALLRDDRYSLAIASNQGGCDFHDFSANCLLPGHRFKWDEEVFKVDSVADRPEESLIVDCLSDEFEFSKGDRVLVQYKTIEDAIEELQYAADLAGIDIAMFCPDMAGQRCFDMTKSIDAIYGHPKTIDRIWKVGEITCDGIMIENYRKPGPGMLTWASISSNLESWDYRVMIGDRPEDKAAADAAGFVFLDAAEWRSGVTVDQAIERSEVAV